MASPGCIVVLLLVLISASLTQQQSRDRFRIFPRKTYSPVPSTPTTPDCPRCNPHSCPIPKGCVAGLVKDHCECCDICGKSEYELCDHAAVKVPKGVHLGKCGDNLECRLRQDLAAGDEREAICYCEIKDDICGSDGNSYDNMCQLMAAVVIKKERITVINKGPCKSGPKMISGPEHAKNVTGTNVALACEAEGFPIPSIEWMWTRVDGKKEFLPNDDLRIAVNMRGGPERSQVTGWMQIMDLQKEHEGDYTCIVQNDLGVEQATARVKAIEH